MDSIDLRDNCYLVLEIDKRVEKEMTLYKSVPLLMRCTFFYVW